MALRMPNSIVDRLDCADRRGEAATIPSMGLRSHVQQVMFLVESPQKADSDLPRGLVVALLIGCQKGSRIRMEHLI